MQEIRRAKIATEKLFLCDARCPITSRFCRKEFLKREALCQHQAGGEHDFPPGFSTETKMAMLIGQPGGVLAGGHLPDQLSKSPIVDCVELPADAPGSAAARCHGKFNRPRRKAPHYKPVRLCLELNKLFNERPVLTPQQAWLRLRDMREPDGSRTFSMSHAGSVRALAKGKSCNGCGLNPCTGCRGEGRSEELTRIKLKVPAGIAHGSRIRSSGNGEAGLRGGPSGDLYVVIHIREHDIFEREDNDLYCEVPVPFTIAALGGELEVPTLEGKASIKIPPGTQNSTVFRLRNRGVQFLNSSQRGDLHVQLQVEIPIKLNKDQKELLNQFANSIGTKNSPIREGFFEKAKRFFK